MSVDGFWLILANGYARNKMLRIGWANFGVIINMIIDLGGVWMARKWVGRDGICPGSVYTSGHGSRKFLLLAIGNPRNKAEEREKM